jgi:carbamate kinase
MGPKIMAAIRFIQNGGERTTITDATSLENFDGGTQITK